jgi:NitT/TauT family transport system permease protein
LAASTDQLADQAGAAPAGLGQRLGPALLPLLSLAALFALWHLAALLAANPLRLPTPAAVLLRAGEELAQGDLAYHLGVTLARVAASFALAMTIGTALGIAMGRLPLFDRIAHPWLVFLLNIPALVIIVLAYIWIGLVETAVITAVALNKIPNVVVTVREGARALDRSLLEMAASFRVDRRRTLTHVVLPQLYPYLAAASRSGLAQIWKIVLVTELLGRSSGVGFQIGTFFSLFDVTSILAYSLAFVVVIQVIEWTVMMPIERHVSRWRR